jgi:hypothetical protein
MGSKYLELVKVILQVSRMQMVYVQRAVITLFGLFWILLPSTAFATCCSCAPANGPAKACLTIEESRLTGGLNISGPCANLPMIVGDSLKGWACLPAPLTESQCQPTPQGVCTQGPSDAFTAGNASEPVSQPAASQAEEEERPPIIPNLNTDIPGFAFTEQTNDGTSSLLGEYIAGAYTFGISIAAVAATVMFTYGAFLYLLGAAIPSVKTGRGIMIDAVFGLILVLTAVLVVRTINPELATIKTLVVRPIPPYSDIEETLPSTVTQIGKYAAPQAICRGEACKDYCNGCAVKTPLPSAPWIPAPQQLTRISTSPGISVSTRTAPMMRPEAVEAIKRVGEAAQNAPGGPYTVVIGDTYRPLIDQMSATCRKLCGNTKKQFAAPGASKHGTGIAVDVQLWKGSAVLVTPHDTLTNQAKYTTAENARRLQGIMASAGFVQYCPEIWHYEFGVNEKGEMSTHCPWPPPEPRR